jgi:hypothetical protein
MGKLHKSEHGTFAPVVRERGTTKCTVRLIAANLAGITLMIFALICASTQNRPTESRLQIKQIAESATRARVSSLKMAEELAFAELHRLELSVGVRRTLGSRIKHHIQELEDSGMELDAQLGEVESEKKYFRVRQRTRADSEHILASHESAGHMPRVTDLLRVLGERTNAKHFSSQHLPTGAGEKEEEHRSTFSLTYKLRERIQQLQGLNVSDDSGNSTNGTSSDPDNATNASDRKTPTSPPPPPWAKTFTYFELC